MIRFAKLLAAISVLIGCASGSEQFPEVIDQKVKITLQRTPCYGSCPDYTVSIDGRGQVVFRSRSDALAGESKLHREYSSSDGILFPGTHTDQIDPKLVRELIAKFREAKFFGLEDSYRAQVTDNPAYILTVDTGSASKTVIDYVGEKAGMPLVVKELENAVDRTAGSARWVQGANGLIDWLKKKNFVFSSRAARDLALGGAFENAADATIIGFIEQGTNLSADATPPYGEDVVLGEGLLRASIMGGRARLFNYLAARGWLGRIKKTELERIFADGAAACSAPLVHAFADRGLNIDALGEEGESALGALAHSYQCSSDTERLATAKALLSRGADPNQRDQDGETPIYDVEYLPLLDLLYSQGAVANVRDKKGNSPALSSWTDEIVLRHLIEGAPPIGIYFDGRDLEEQMKYRPMPRVQKWLDTHHTDGR